MDYGQTNPRRLPINPPFLVVYDRRQKVFFHFPAHVAEKIMYFQQSARSGFHRYVGTPPLRFNDRFLHSADGRNSRKKTSRMKTSYAHRTSYHQSGYIIFEPSEELVRGRSIQRMTTDKIAVPQLKQGTYGKSYDSMDGTQIPGYRFTGYRSILRPIRPGQIHPTVKHGSTNRRS